MTDECFDALCKLVKEGKTSYFEACDKVHCALNAMQEFSVLDKLNPQAKNYCAFRAREAYRTYLSV